MRKNILYCKLCDLDILYTSKYISSQIPTSHVTLIYGTNIITRFPLIYLKEEDKKKKTNKKTHTLTELMNRGPTRPLHLKYQTEYYMLVKPNNKAIIFGDYAFDGNALFGYNATTKKFDAELVLRCNERLQAYYDQYIFFKAIMYKKHNNKDETIFLAI